MQVNADFFEYLKINNLFFNRRYYYSFEPSPHHYNTHTWTLGKEFRVLLLFFSATAGISCLFVHFSVSEFDLTLDTFMDLQLYNGVLSVVYIPIFRYFIHNRLTPTQPMRYAKRTAPEKSIVSSPAVEITENPDEQQARKALQRLHEVMETEQLCLSNKCNLLLISEHTGIPVHRISNTINTYSGCSFTDFVNKYRIENECRILQEGKNKRLKLEAIGMECGFGSKVNFYLTFKKLMGKTPAKHLTGL